MSVYLYLGVYFEVESNSHLFFSHLMGSRVEKWTSPSTWKYTYACGCAERISHGVHHSHHSTTDAVLARALKYWESVILKIICELYTHILYALQMLEGPLQVSCQILHKWVGRTKKLSSFKQFLSPLVSFRINQEAHKPGSRKS